MTRQTKTLWVTIPHEGTFDECWEVHNVPWTLWMTMPRVMSYLGHENILVSDRAPRHIPSQSIAVFDWPTLYQSAVFVLLARLAGGRDER